MVREEIRMKIKNFLGKFIKNQEIADNDDIFKIGIVNSLFTMQLVIFIEKEYGIIIQNKDIDLENFNSINAITNLIESKKES